MTAQQISLHPRVFFFLVFGKSVKWSCVSISLLQNGILKKHATTTYNNWKCVIWMILMGIVLLIWGAHDVSISIEFFFVLIDILFASKREIYCRLRHMTLCTKEILFQNNNAAGRPKNIPSFKVKSRGERTQLKMNRSLVYVILLFITASTCAPELAFQWKHSICIAPSVYAFAVFLSLSHFM